MFRNCVVHLSHGVETGRGLLGVLKNIISNRPASPASVIKPGSGINDKPLLPSLLTIVAICMLTAGCLGGRPLVEVAVIDERTALENQILGSYQELDKEVLLLASVRAIDKTGKLVKTTPLPPGKRAVIRAIQRSSFNKDDVDALKHDGILGENREGFLSILSNKGIPEGKNSFVKNLVDEENSDRRVIMQRLVDVNENMSDRSMPDIQKIFASLNRDRALKDDIIQTPDGIWIPKK